MERMQRRLPLPPTDILTVAGITIVIFFALAFGGKALEGYRLRRYNEQLRAEIAELQQKQEELKAQLTYVQSPEYVERVAREEYRWVRPGDKLVIPIYRTRPPQAATPTAQASLGQARASQAGASHWPEWQELLFGSLD
jgi:cell division protein FtsB